MPRSVAMLRKGKDEDTDNAHSQAETSMYKIFPFAIMNPLVSLHSSTSQLMETGTQTRSKLKVA